MAFSWSLVTLRAVKLIDFDTCLECAGSLFSMCKVGEEIALSKNVLDIIGNFVWNLFLNSILMPWGRGLRSLCQIHPTF